MDIKTFFLSLVIALLMGTAAIFEKASLKEASPMTVFTIRTLFMSCCLVAMSTFSQGLRPLVQISGQTLLFILVPAVFATIFVSLYFSILQHDLASRALPLISSAPVVTVLLSIFFLGEPFSWRRFIGALLIVVGVSLVK